jgi:hypothetical protein
MISYELPDITLDDGFHEFPEGLGLSSRNAPHIDSISASAPDITIDEPNMDLDDFDLLAGGDGLEDDMLAPFGDEGKLDDHVAMEVRSAFCRHLNDDSRYCFPATFHVLFFCPVQHYLFNIICANRMSPYLGVGR